MIHIYIKNGNIDQIARRICALDPIESVEIRIGNDTMDKFDSQVGLRHLKLIHLNDSRDKFFSRRDRHEHVGLGEIGKEGFNAFLKHKSNKNTPLIMETPIDTRRSNSDNLKFVKSIIDST